MNTQSFQTDWRISLYSILNPDTMSGQASNFCLESWAPTQCLLLCYWILLNRKVKDMYTGYLALWCLITWQYVGEDPQLYRNVTSILWKCSETFTPFPWRKQIKTHFVSHPVVFLVKTTDNSLLNNVCVNRIFELQNFE